jgi:putative ABC transport system permease protein
VLVDITENLRVAADGITSNKLRSSLTMLGVIIGVAAVIALMSIGRGAQASITDQINSVGSNLVFVFGGQNGSQGLTLADADAMADVRSVPAAISVAPQFGQSTQVIFGDEDVSVSVMGVTPEYRDAYTSVEVARGAFIEAKDVTARSSVAVLGYQTAQDLFGGFDPVGQKIKVQLPGGNGGRVSLTVVGVLAEQNSNPMNDPNQIVLVPITTAQFKIFDGRNALGEPILSQVVVVAASEDQSYAAADEIKALLRARHNLDQDEDDDFRVANQADLLDVTTQVTSTMTVFLGAIAGISLLVGGIGIMNIMLVSVTERTREIGLRKAVGARKADILIQFLLEAVVLSLVGGVLGIVLGAILANLVSLSGMMTAVVSLDSILLATGFSAAIGVFFGIYPANEAAKLNPIEALRYE